jgi:predicted NBD/HSP70 family sugar kinase
VCRFVRIPDKVVRARIPRLGRSATAIEQPAKATIRQAREHNERLVLATIYDDGPVSRAEVARRTGLTRTTVSDVVDGLLAGGLAREIGRGPSTGGKAPILIEVPPDAWHLIGLDLGDTVFRGAIVNLRGDPVTAVVIPAPTGQSTRGSRAQPAEDWEPAQDGERAMDVVYELIERLVALADRPLLGIGIGAPGLIDSTVGTVVQAVNVDWRHLPLAHLVRSRFGLPTYVANDSQAAALAEHVFGPVRNTNLIGIKVGEGIGAGLVLNGELFQGDGFGAGEIGHMVVHPDGARCRCGRSGCLETVASARAVVRRVSVAAGRPVTLDEATEAFARGDEGVVRAVLEAGEELGLAIAGLVGAVNVQRIVLAGSMAAFGQRWVDAVASSMGRSALPALVRETSLELGGLDDIVVLGASALLLTRELGLRLRPTRLAVPPGARRATSGISEPFLEHTIADRQHPRMEEVSGQAR